ncbi:MAG: hypothetical protein JSR37_06795 [Verrucomicrobia bacterium]|nr:hypothetical protein [Verrucomicrobiota bacterium]
MSSNLPPVGSGSTVPPDKFEETKKTITAHLTGVNQKIENLTKNPQTGIFSVADKIKGSFYNIQKKWFTFRLDNLPGPKVEVSTHTVSEKVVTPPKVPPKPSLEKLREKLVNNSISRKVLANAENAARKKDPGEEVVAKLLKGEMIETRGGSKVPLSDALLTRNASVIPTSVLFQRVAVVLAIGNPQDQTQLLDFATKWVERNKGTKEFVNAKETLELIRDMQGLPQEALQKFQAALKAAPIVRTAPKFTEGGVKTDDILRAVRAGELTGAKYSEAVERLASDLFIINSANYNQLQPDDLAAKKWVKTPAAVQEIRDTFNALAGLIRQAVLVDNSPKSQEKMANFFKDVGEACLKRKNIEGVKAIVAALQDVSDVDIEEMKELVKDNSQNIRTFYEKNKEAIPYIGTYLNDIEKGENIPADNPSKLVTLQTAEQQLLKFQGVKLGEAISSDLYTRMKNVPSTQDEQVLRGLDLKHKAALKKLTPIELGQYMTLMKGEPIDKEASDNLRTAIRAARNLEKMGAANNKEALKKIDEKFAKIEQLIG